LRWGNYDIAGVLFGWLRLVEVLVGGICRVMVAGLDICAKKWKEGGRKEWTPAFT